MCACAYVCASVCVSVCACVSAGVRACMCVCVCVCACCLYGAYNSYSVVRMVSRFQRKCGVGISFFMFDSYS